MKKTIWFLVIKFFLAIFGYTTYSLLQNDNKYYFYNYDQFISESIEKQISNKYGFKSFGDTNGLEAQINQKKVLGAMSSDYHIKKLIKEKKIAKIDYKKIFDDKGLSDFENLYINAIKKHKPIKVDNKEVCIFDYTIPYYYQYKVIAFDIRKVNPISLRSLLLKKNKEINDSRIDELINNIDNNKKDWWKNFSNQDIREYLLKNIDEEQEYKHYFKILEQIGLKNLIVNDYTRDVLYIGSSGENNKDKMSKLETNDYQNNFKTWINNFLGNISSYKKNGNIHYTENGTEALTRLIDPNSKFNVALMYNGDAFDAFNHANQFKKNNNDNFFIRIIKPRNNFGIFDGLVMPKYIQKTKYEDSFYKIVKDYFIGNNFDNLKNPSFDNQKKSPLNENYEFTRFNTVFESFNEKVIEKFKNEYQEQEHKDTITENAKDIFTLSNDYNYLETLDNNLFAQIFAYYKIRKFSNN